ncbi:metallophosphoesterase [Actinophytocola xanthii]|uniref:metallophosphoesterase n=1 Tax=Actinophytocola xanthii TaxID=1912961 RepID=UPI0009FA1F65|nr:metallophosphoesterase [Actinophytocola xanthii]
MLDYLDDIPGEVNAVLVTGDITDHGTPAEYQEAARLLGTCRFPVLTCPGNHDERSAYRAVFPDGRAESPVNQVHRLAGATFAMCDSSIPGRAGDLLDDSTIDWLDEVLTAAPRDEPAFVCFHHPPVRLGVPFVDAIRQFGEQRLAELLQRHQHVLAVLCGYVHTAAAATFAGLPLRVAPGVVSMIVPPRETGTIIDYRLPPGFAFRAVGEDRGLVTHFRSL